MPTLRAMFIWAAFIAALLVPLIIAATSPLIQWRQPIYILAGFAGIFGLGLMLAQPLLAAGALPGLSPMRTRQMHRITGTAIALAVAVHVAGLWVTSPPDMIDALTFASPTLFSPFGVIAMWAIFAAALLAALRRRMTIRWNAWQLAHAGLAALAVVTTAAHAMLIDGTMGTYSKAALCVLVVGATGWALRVRRVGRAKRPISR